MDHASIHFIDQNIEALRQKHDLSRVTQQIRDKADNRPQAFMQVWSYVVTPKLFVCLQYFVYSVEDEAEVRE